MPHIPQHKAMLLCDAGIILRRIGDSEISISSKTYAHQDDYYIFGIVESGSWSCLIDFEERHFYQGDVFIIQPGQVHSFLQSECMKGWLLFADCSLVDNNEKRILDNFSLFSLSFKVDERCMKELAQIAVILAERLDGNANELTKTTIRKLSAAFISIVCEGLQNIGLQEVHHSRRNIEIVLSFRHLLTEHITENRQPAFYASLLNISTVYLNEVVRKVTGMNATSYIKSEVVLQAKRLLIHTDLAIKEIATHIGIEDTAYFSRLFTQATGVSPSMFRHKNLG